MLLRLLFLVNIEYNTLVNKIFFFIAYLDNVLI